MWESGEGGSVRSGEGGVCGRVVSEGCVGEWGGRECEEWGGRGVWESGEGGVGGRVVREGCVGEWGGRECEEW